MIASSHREPGTTIDTVMAGGANGPSFRQAEGSRREAHHREDFIARVTDATPGAVFVVLSVPPDALTTSLADVLLPELAIVSMLAFSRWRRWVLGEALIARPAEALARATTRFRSGLEVPATCRRMRASSVRSALLSGI